MKPLSKADIWLRGALYVCIGGLMFLQSSEDFRLIVPKIVLVVIGTLLSMAVALRAYIDQSTTQGDKPEPIPVKTEPGQPLETVETAAPTTLEVPDAEQVN